MNKRRKFTNRTADKLSSRTPAPSRATLIPSMRSKRSHKGSFVGGRTPTRIFYHSHLEYKAAIVLLARPDVADLWEQPPAFEYRENARVRHYTFDFLVTLVDGRRYLVEVKPERLAEEIGLRARLTWLGTRLPVDCADGILIITERHLPHAVVADAELIHSVRREMPGEDDAAVMAVMSDLVGSATIADVVASTGLAGRAFRAIVRRIADGDLVLASPRPITPASRVALRNA